MKNFLLRIFLYLTLVVLLFFPSYCADGVLLGIKLFINSLLPAILPFIIFSNFMIQHDYSWQIGRLFYPITHTLFGVSYYGSYAVIMGFLCGYPVGAKITSDLYLNGSITKAEADYILKFVNHASPSFIQGYVVLSLLNTPEYRFIAIILTYLPEVITGIIFRRHKSYKNIDISVSRLKYPINKILDDSLSNAILTVVKIGGYLIIFTTIAGIIMKITFISDIFKVIIVALLEITSGTYYLSLLNISLPLRLLCIIAACILGGVSTFFQINSVLSKFEYKKRDYLYSKCVSLIIMIILYVILFTIFN